MATQILSSIYGVDLDDRLTVITTTNPNMDLPQLIRNMAHCRQWDPDMSMDIHISYLTNGMIKHLSKFTREDSICYETGILFAGNIEACLHPKAQQQVIADLLTQFPNRQLVVSTVSPIILTTVNCKNVRVLITNPEYEYGYEVYTPSFQTKGAYSDSVLTHILDTPIYPNIEEANWLNHFARYLKANDKESLECVFDKIKSHFGTNHPMVIDCESKIRIAEMKAKFNK